MFDGVLALLMEKFSVKRGLVKQIGGNAGLAKLATEYFDNVNANSDGEFTASFGILTKVSGQFDKAYWGPLESIFSFVIYKLYCI